MNAAELGRTNAPALLAAHARARADTVAFRSKARGIYRERTWRDYAVLVGRAARALRGLGVVKGERVAIMGDPCEEWMVCDLAAQALGAVTYGIYPTASASEVEYQLRDGGASVFVAEDQEYVDRILPFADRLPGLRWILVIDSGAMFAYDHPKLCDYRAALEQEACSEVEALALLADLAGKIAPRDPAFIVYTSGTTGNPKGALVAHGRHLAAAYNLVEHYPLLAEPQRTVVYLPLCHILGRDVAITLPLLGGMVPHFGEGPGGSRADAVRGRADRALHRAALPAEVRVAGARRGRQLERREARGVRLGDARRPAPRARALGGRDRRRSMRSPTPWRGRSRSGRS